MIDALTGETNIEEPVVSIKSGNVYEKRVISKYLRDNGKGPSIDQDLTSEDLIALKVNKIVKPRPPAATSIPGMLQLFQNEWDALMLESFTLKQQLDSVRQELAHSLYQHDAACRVIARLMKERDEARNALSSFQASSQQATSSESMDVDSESQVATLSEDIIDNINKKNKELSSARKKKKTATSETLATPEDIKKYKATSTTGVHSTSPPGILTVDIHPEQQDLILTGGADTHITLYNRATKKIISSMKSHTKAVTKVAFHPTEKAFVSSSADKTAKVWTANGSDNYEVAHTIEHAGEVKGVDVHPSLPYFVAGSTDSTWSYNSIASGETLLKVQADGKINFLQFHPDGTLLGTGIGSILRLWDTRTSKIAASFEGHEAPLLNMSSSQNGFYLSTVAEDQSIKLWDLRNLQAVDTYDLGDKFGAASIEFDHSGNYLAATGGNSIQILSVKKKLEEAATHTGHKGIVTCLKWGADAQWFVSGSMDRNLKFWTTK